MQPKTLSKLIKRLAKQYNLPDDVIPNVIKGKVRGQLQFLVRKNYSEKSLSKDAWREMVLEIVPKTAELDLKLELIDGCSYNNDMNEAVYWARYFNVPQKDLPLMVQDHIKDNRDSVRKNYNKKCDQNDNKKNSPKRNDSRTDATRYYSLKESKTPNFISYVDRRDTFDEMLSYLSRQHLVAFDAEWNPIKTPTSSDLALIQFATAERIFLIDVISGAISIEYWNRLATTIFNNLEILKLGKRKIDSVSITFFI